MQATTGGTRNELLISLRQLSDDELVARLKGLAARERRATALLVAHLAELDTRDVYLRAGYASLFAYCRDVLALSDHEAYNRIEAARTARRFPAVLDLLAAGEVNLTTVRLLGPHLTAENHLGVLESARGKRKAEVEEIVARLSPRPDVPASVRKLPEGKATASSVDTLGAAGRVAPMARAAAPEATVRSASAEADPVAHAAGALVAAAGCLPSAAVPRAVSTGPVVTPAAPLAAPGEALAMATGSVAPADLLAGAVPVLPQPRRSAEVKPLSPDRYRYQLTIGGATLEKLRLARDMLRHALPSGDDEALLDRALTALLKDLARKKFAAEERAASSGKPAPRSGLVRALGRGSRHVPASVKRAVWVRDLGRCAFVGTGGRRCGERAFLEFHHVQPYAAGGGPSVENIQLRCQRHNGYEARLYFAPESVGDGQCRAGMGSSARVSGSAGASRLVPERVGAIVSLVSD